VQKDDVIVTQGTRDRRYPDLYPYGIPIGTVINVGRNDTRATSPCRWRRSRRSTRSTR
jgi:hypothetical protein